LFDQSNINIVKLLSEFIEFLKEIFSLLF